MQRFYVWKRIINDYRVAVEAETPEQAVVKAYENDHGPGELDSWLNDGDTFYPSEWAVADAKEFDESDGGPVPIEFDRAPLKLSGMDE
jgi:hypothetical protein